MPSKTTEQKQGTIDIDPEKINPTNPTEFARRGWAFYYLHNYSSAQDSFQEALQTSPDDIDFQYGLALTYRALGKNPEALKTFEKILRMIDSIDDRVRATMLKRLAFGQIHQITQGDWNLGELVWQIKP